jgi:drug/metabolite transporter (DMT)-like permease
VQPCIASGLILLLWLGVTRLGAAPGRRELLAVAAIVVGIAGVAWAAPERSTDHAGAGSIAAALALVAVPVIAPYAFRRRAGGLATLAIFSAGCGYAWTSIASKLLTDELAAGTVLVAVAWLATAAASESLALLSEMSALQRRPATHVAPAMFATQVLVPVVLAPLIFDESWAETPLGGFALLAFVALAVAGTVLLAGSKPVGAVIESAHAED